MMLSTAPELYLLGAGLAVYPCVVLVGCH